MFNGKTLLAATLAGTLVLGLPASAHANPVSSTRLAVVDTAKAGHGYSRALTQLATVTVTVAPGDTLSGLASRHCGNSTWTGIYQDNQTVVGNNPNLIYPGQRLAINCASGTAATAPAPAPQAAAPAAAPASSGWVAPVNACITSGYGSRQLAGRAAAFHWGVDLGAGYGAPIHAVNSGTVVSSGWIYSGYGIDTLIQNDGGDWSHYAHQSQTIVGPGQHVEAGEVIGYVGATGDVTGPHLHFEIWTRGSWGGSNPQINPIAFMADHGVTLGC